MAQLQKPHLINTVRHEPGTYSCAIDCFLEITSSIFLPYLKEISRSNVFELLYNSCMHYTSVVVDTNVSDWLVIINLLYDVREPIWSYLREKCRSLSAKNSNAQFSEIFQFCNFGQANEFERQIFLSTTSLNSHCSGCNKALSANTDIFVHYITSYDVTSLSNSFDWSE